MDFRPICQNAFVMLMYVAVKMHLRLSYCDLNFVLWYLATTITYWQLMEGQVLPSQPHSFSTWSFVWHFEHVFAYVYIMCFVAYVCMNLEWPHKPHWVQHRQKQSQNKTTETEKQSQKYDRRSKVENTTETEQQRQQYNGIEEAKSNIRLKLTSNVKSRTETEKQIQQNYDGRSKVENTTES